MKRAIEIMEAMALLGLALLMGGCAASSNLMQRGPTKPDSEVLQSFVCRGESLQADNYLVALGVPLSDRIAMIERARLKGCPTQTGGVK